MKHFALRLVQYISQFMMVIPWFRNYLPVRHGSPKLQQDEVIDTDIASFRSITGQYTDRQDAFWLLLLESNASLLDGLAHASSAPCVGVRGEACRAGWARVAHAVGSAPLWPPPCADEN